MGPSLSKITRPAVATASMRGRVFSLLDESRSRPVTWIFAPAGSGKTTLVASYLDFHKIPCLWYSVDEGDGDIASFFYYMGMAAEKAAPGKHEPLPVLTPEYLQGIPAFTRRYFEELFGRVLSQNSPVSPFAKGGIKKSGTFPPLGKGGEGGFAIVFDNFQDAPADSRFHEIISHGLDVIPKGINLFILSRNEPPLQFASHYVGSRISLVEWGNIKFTIEETIEFLRMKELPVRLDAGTGLKPAPAEGNIISGLSDEAIMKLHRKTEGWVAGLVLVLECAKTDGIDCRSLDKLALDEVFTYFTSQIFSRTNKRTRIFLLKTAFLPSMTAKTANRLTKMENAGEILSGLNLNHYFTEMRFGEEPVYTYHPLFREFLLSKARDTLSSGEIAGIQRNAAGILMETGNAEDAASLLLDAKDWEGLTGLILKEAQPLINQGRNKTLEPWLRAIPEDCFRQEPWLWFWLGSARFSFNPEEARGYFEKALETFKLRRDAEGIFLSWSNISASYAYGMDSYQSLGHWIDVYDELTELYPVFHSRETEVRAVSGMVVALALKQTEYARIDACAEHLFSLFREDDDIAILIRTYVFMSIYYLWRGEFKKGAALVERLREDISSSSASLSPIATVTLRMMDSQYYYYTWQPDQCMKAVSEGLREADKSGIHAYDVILIIGGVRSAIMTGDLDAAKNYIQEMSSRLNPAKVLDAFFYHAISAWYAILTGDLHAAYSHLEAVREAVKRSGSPYHEGVWNLGMAQVLYLKGDGRKALEHLDRVHGISLEMQSYVLECFYHLTSAWVLFNEGNKEGCLNALRQGMTLGREHDYLDFWWWNDLMISSLCKTALDNDIEVEYARHLVSMRKLALVPSLSPKESEVLKWLADGKDTWAISKIMEISERTVKFHIGNITTKLDAVNRAHAVSVAAKYGLIRP